MCFDWLLMSVNKYGSGMLFDVSCKSLQFDEMSRSWRRHAAADLLGSELYIRSVKTEKIAPGSTRAVQCGHGGFYWDVACFILVLCTGVFDSWKVKPFGSFQSKTFDKDFGVALVRLKADTIAIPCNNSIQ